MGLFDGLIGWSIRHRHVVLLAAIALVVVGIWSASRATLDVVPDFTPPRVVVQTESPGMSTLDVEELVTRPLERALLGTPQATSVRSSSAAGLSVVTMMFEDGVDIYRARQLVSERLRLVAAQLPASGEEPQLAAISPPIGAVLKFCLTSTAADPVQAARDLRAFADWTLRPRLLAIAGVAQVTAHGGEVERIEVRPDPVRLRARAVTVDQVAAAVTGSQAITGAGFVDVGAARLDVQADARLTVDGAAEAIGETVVAMRGPRPVRVADVADVVHGGEPAVGAAIYDGKAAVYVQVSKLPWADTLQVTRDVEHALRELARQLPPGATVEPPVFRQADFVHTSIRSVGRAMAIGSVLVVIVLIAFLRRGRLAAISLAAIPLSMLAATTILVARGISINGMTLGGLALAVGEVVDDAIVDVENVWRRLRDNARVTEPRPVLDVVRAASREVRSSVVYATIIVGLVLVPVLFLGGIAGRIFSPLAQAYILAIASSLLVALTVTPALCALLLPKLATRSAEPTRFARWTVTRYRRAIGRIVEHPRIVLAMVGIAALAAALVLPLLGGRFLPEFQERTLIGELQAPPGTSLAETTRLALLVDGQLRPAVAAHVAARIGRAELDDDAAAANRVEMDVFLRPGDDREQEEIGLDVAKHIAAVPGLGFTVEGFLGERIQEILAGETSPVVVELRGPDLGRLRTLAAEVSVAMATVAGIDRPRVEPQVAVTELRIRPDPAALAARGLRPLDVLEQVVAWRQGRRVTQILSHDGRVMDVVVAGPPELRTRAALPDLPIQTPAGVMVPLSELATIDEAPAPATINHDGGERRITIGADGESGAVAALATKLAAIELPDGYRVDLGGEAVARRAAALRLLLVGGLVLLGVYALLATAFGSLADAGIVLLNLPLGLIGGVAGAALTPDGVSVAGFVGFVTLFGIISRNGIMMVAHKQHLDASRPELDPVARVLLAAEERVLPIVMTAATAGLALLPLAASIEAAGSELEAPMALIVLCGLVTSTALNMIVLPTLYVWLARRRQRRTPGMKESSP